MSANISNANTQIPSEEIVLGDFIAAGGMGKVYKAKKSISDRKFCVASQARFAVFS